MQDTESEGSWAARQGVLSTVKMFEDELSKEGSKMVKNMQGPIGIPRNDNLQVHYKLWLCMTVAVLLWVMVAEVSETHVSGDFEQI